MRRLVYLAAARSDLLIILETVTEISGSLQTGRRYVDRIRAHCRKLAGLPGLIGRPRPELPHGIRSSACGSHVVYFRYVGDTVEVVSVLHARRDVTAAFAPDEEG
jgi:plasmid stabilization system protein ParE